MGVAELSALQRAIGSGDALTLTKVFGIGKKSAERIVVELRDKLNIETSTQQFSENSSNHAEVIEALMALGYSAAECRNALTHMENTGDSLKEKIGAALKQLGSPLSRNKGNSFTV
jgi:Holliday junction DNA helicase RuvA